jgi:hypothetical protein
MCGVDKVAISFAGGNVSRVETGTTRVGDAISAIGGAVSRGTVSVTVGGGFPLGSPFGEHAHRIKVQKSNARKILGIFC